MLLQHDNYQNNDELISQNLQTQNAKLMEKIKERRERSFSRSISKMGIQAQTTGPKNSESDSNTNTSTNLATKGKPLFKSGVGSKRGDNCNILGDDLLDEDEGDAEEPFTGQFLTENILSMINSPDELVSNQMNENPGSKLTESNSDSLPIRKGPKPV
jgi:hypothetical protein